MPVTDAAPLRKVVIRLLENDNALNKLILLEDLAAACNGAAGLSTDGLHVTADHIFQAFRRNETLNIKDVLGTDTDHVFRLDRHRPDKRSPEIKSAGRFKSSGVEMGEPHKFPIRGWAMDDADINILKEFLKQKEDDKKKRAADDEKSSKKKTNKKRKKAKAKKGERDDLDEEEKQRLEKQRLSNILRMCKI